MPKRQLKPFRNLQTGNAKERIVKQSLRLFLEKGYHGTSIDDITRAADLTKGAFYWYFRGKEDLLKGIIKEYEKQFLEGLAGEVRKVRGGAVDRFKKMLSYNAAFALHNRELCISFTTLAAELVGAHHGIETEFRRVYKKYQAVVSRMILEGKKEKSFKEEIDPDLGALVTIAFHDGLLLQWSMNRNKINGEAYVKTFRKIFLEGLVS